MYFDLTLDELLAYKPKQNEPADFGQFWAETLRETRSIPNEINLHPVDCGLKYIDAFDVAYRGYGGKTIKGWLLVPNRIEEKMPALVYYIGYGGGRGFPFDWLLWPNMGYITFVMDTRGQGSSWRQGETADIEPEGSSPQHVGWMTKGILDPSSYYYRRLITDAVCAVDVVRDHPKVDKSKLAVIGRSQGGGVALAVAGLRDDISIVMPDIPFLCHYRRAIEITDSAPYSEITQFCKVHRDKVDQVFHTLSYFDGVNFASRASAKALFSVGLMDLTCPPSTVFAAYNHYSGPKEIRIWEFNDHEGGESYQIHEQIKYFAQHWG